MPLIKDKYSKSPKSRSRYLVDRKVVTTPTVISPYKTTEQKLFESAKVRRIEKDRTVITANTNNISGRTLSTVNIVENIFTLDAGSTLKDIIISHYHVSGTSCKMSLHWSSVPSEDLTFTADQGVITAVTGGNTFRLFSDILVSTSTLSLASNGLFNTFENVNKPIYFYAVCSVLGPTFTIVKK